MDRGKQFLQQVLGASDDNLAKFEVMALGWILLGALVGLAGVAIAVAHYRFGVVIHQNHGREPADPAALRRTFGLMIGVGSFFVVAGAWIRRVCARWYDSE